MNLQPFTVEEENLICFFDTSSRAALVADLRYALPYFDEAEILELTENLLKRLNAMNYAEFSELSFNPAYFNDDDEQEG